MKFCGEWLMAIDLLSLTSFSYMIDANCSYSKVPMQIVLCNSIMIPTYYLYYYELKFVKFPLPSLIWLSYEWVAL